MRLAVRAKEACSFLDSGPILFRALESLGAAHFEDQAVAVGGIRLGAGSGISG
jgi:hypothetical protein